jgi:bifunctional UDP-N-acetylglucosamine pyrophosphorylase/glucosamine-1-phosphate N-acetyltransferase
MSIAAIVLAAGKGTRMTADLPKVLHTIDERPMISYVIDAIQPVAGERVYLVVGYGADQVMKACSDRGVRFVKQEPQLGTGHAVMQCEKVLESFDGTVVVLNGDVPCLRSETIRQFVAHHTERGGAATVLTAILDNPFGYGRVVKDSDGSLAAIVEEKDADEETKKTREINSGLFCFARARLFDALTSIDRDNAQNEYYLTDVIAELKRSGDGVYSYCVSDAQEVAGVNTDEELEAVRRHLRGGTR